MIPRKTSPWLHKVALWIYTGLLFVLLPLIVLFYRKKLRLKENLGEDAPVRRFRERLGILPPEIKDTEVLFHCASVGELNASEQIIKQLLNRPDKPNITITTTSVTGARHAYGLFGKDVQHCFLPIDIPVFVNPLLERLKPNLVCIVESECWPNLFDLVTKNKIKLLLVNARMTDKSLRNYKRLAMLYKYTFRKIDAICAQSQQAYDNFLEIGVYKPQLFLTNNTKFDLEENPQDKIIGTQLVEQFSLQSATIILGASTHAPEEQLLLASYAKLKEDFDSLILLLVPRYPHRFEEVYQICNATGFTVSRLSEKTTYAESSDIVLIDAMGMLKACYSFCDIAFVGGSFAEKGGHNPLEAALYAKPMLMGTSLYNNFQICNALAEAEALKICHTENELANELELQLANAEDRKKKGKKARQILNENRGAVTATVKILLLYLNVP